ncbi:MAG: SDR family NAD(P)-dependent oxidoreductase [Deltaproteobacteria bacterium]|nr:SDR family NAD(P)-dependent oxidoreductase [Deltaproteobacteria bacterium]
MKIKGKVALVTGGNTRVGKIISETLSRHGALVAAHSFRSKKGPFQADLSKLSGVQKLVRAVEKNLGPIDILINNASDFKEMPLTKITEADWDYELAVNLKAPFFLSQAVAASMIKRKQGVIINILDDAIFKPYLNHAPYMAAKGGLATLTQTLARELAPHVRVNAIAPGPTLPEKGLSKKRIKNIAQRIPLGTWGNPQEVANAIIFLLETNFATGTILTLNGGRLLI